jgi:hypothetical protein
VPKDDQQTSSRAALVDEHKKCKLIIAKRKSLENNNNWPASFRNPPMITSIFPSQLTKATVSCSDHGFKNDESLA